jgi:hypothetical protein
MKTILQIVVAFILLTGTVQAGRAAVKHYAFTDAVHEAMIFASSRTEDQIADRVLEIAAQHFIPLDPENLSVVREPYQISISAPYSDTVNLLPGVYKHRWDFDTEVNVRLLEDTRPRGTAPRGRRPQRR